MKVKNEEQIKNFFNIFKNKILIYLNLYKNFKKLFIYYK